MASRQGRIALQLTRWVGGTIIVLMFAFVIADYWISHRVTNGNLEDLARRGVEGRKALLESGKTFETVKSYLDDTEYVAEYVEEQDNGTAVFDVNGDILFKSSGVISSDAKESEALSRPPSGPRVETRYLKVGSIPMVAAVVSFETKEDTPVKGYVAYAQNAARYQQSGLLQWGLRSGMILLIIVGVMLAVRIPVKKFVVAPIDGLFMAAYAASRDDYQRMPTCPVDNEFAELYDMFNRMMGHLSDTRTPEGPPNKEDEFPEDILSDQPREER